MAAYYGINDTYIPRSRINLEYRSPSPLHHHHHHPSPPPSLLSPRRRNRAHSERIRAITRRRESSPLASLRALRARKLRTVRAVRHRGGGHCGGGGIRVVGSIVEERARENETLTAR